MSRHIVVAAFAIALGLGTAHAASAQDTARPERRERSAQDSSFRRGRGGPGGMLLRGITLTADQQARVAKLREANRPTGDRANGAPGTRAERQRGDTTGFGARRQEMAQRRAQQSRALREILTPAQRVQFDRNVAEMKAHEGERGNGRRGGRDGGAPQRPESK